MNLASLLIYNQYGSGVIWLSKIWFTILVVRFLNVLSLIFENHCKLNHSNWIRNAGLGFCTATWNSKEINYQGLISTAATAIEKLHCHFCKIDRVWAKVQNKEKNLTNSHLILKGRLQLMKVQFNIWFEFSCKMAWYHLEWW